MNTIKVKDLFDNKAELAACLTTERLGQPRMIVKRSSPSRVVYACSIEGCTGSLMASARGGSSCFVVRKSTPHTCNRSEKLTPISERRLTAHAVAHNFIANSPVNGNILSKDIAKFMLSKFQVSISSSMAKRAKLLVYETWFGNPEKSYSQLSAFFKAFLQNDKEVHTVLETSNERFKRCFLAFGVSKHGFSNCLPLLFLESFYLDNIFKGVILVASSLDANSQMFPLAFALVLEETEENWKWFLEQFEVGIGQRSPLVVISDRQDGIIDAVKKYMPDAEHALSVHHLVKEFQKHHKGTHSGELIWTAAKALTINEFESAMKKLQSLRPNSRDFFVGKWAPEHWSTCHFAGNRYGHFASHFEESCDKLIFASRGLPITRLVNDICIKMMACYSNQRMLANEVSDSSLSPNAFSMLQQMKKSSTDLTVFKLNSDQFDVISVQQQHFKVDLSTKTCSCMYWQKTGVTCCHVIAVLAQKSINPEQECDPLLKGAAYKATYFASVPPPMPELSSLKMDKLNPPLVVTSPGRPTTKRFRPYN